MNMLIIAYDVWLPPPPPPTLTACGWRDNPLRPGVDEVERESALVQFEPAEPKPYEKLTPVPKGSLPKLKGIGDVTAEDGGPAELTPDRPNEGKEEAEVFGTEPARADDDGGPSFPNVELENDCVDGDKEVLDSSMPFIPAANTLFVFEAR